MKYDEALLDEVSELLDLTREFSESADVPVIFDGSQYTLKIPKSMAEGAGLQRGAAFRFTLKVAYTQEGKKTLLEGKLEEGDTP